MTIAPIKTAAPFCRLSIALILPTLPNPTPPSAADVSAVTDQDTPIDVTLSGADLVDCELIFSIVTPPMHGTLGSITNHACSLGLPSSDTATVTYTPAVSALVHGRPLLTHNVTDFSAVSGLTVRDPLAE